MCAKVILSTDPGIDDAMAIAFLNKLNSLEIVWTTMGNNTLEKCTNNAVKILELLGKREIPIIKGAAEPISKKDVLSAGVHGKDGLGNTNLPMPDLSLCNWKSLDFIISLIKKNPLEYTLVSIGPLTNLAFLIQKAPKTVIKLIKQVIIMGGAINVPGNVTPYAEFNVYCDPHAAEIVFNSDVPTTLVGLDVTQKVTMKTAHIQKLEKRGTELTKFIAKIAQFYSNFHLGVDGCFLHDPLAAAIAIDPTLVNTQDLNIEIITDDPDKAGQIIVVDDENSPKISVALEVNTEKFMNLFMKTLLK